MHVKSINICVEQKSQPNFVVLKFWLQTTMSGSHIFLVAFIVFSLASVVHLAGTVDWTGVNLAGGEFGRHKYCLHHSAWNILTIRIRFWRKLADYGRHWLLCVNRDEYFSNPFQVGEIATYPRSSIRFIARECPRFYCKLRNGQRNLCDCWSAQVIPLIHQLYITFN